MLLKYFFYNKIKNWQKFYLLFIQKQIYFNILFNLYKFFLYTYILSSFLYIWRQIINYNNKKILINTQKIFNIKENTNKFIIKEILCEMKSAFLGIQKIKNKKT